MKKSTERKMNIVVIAILGFNVAGVISILIIRSIMYPGDLIENGSLLLETVPARGTSLSDVETCAHPNELVVTGHIRRDEGAEVAGQGEVEITLFSPNGDVLERGSGWYRLPPVPDRRSAHFEMRLHASPPKGSILHIESTQPETQPAINPGAPEASREGLDH